MSVDPAVGFRVVNYKAFGPDGCRVQSVKPINLIIGRNNSGKSALLDVVEFLAVSRDLGSHAHRGSKPEVYITVPTAESVVSAVFKRNTSGGSLGTNHFEYGKRYIDQPIELLVDEAGKLHYSNIADPPPAEFLSGMASRSVNPFQGKTVLRLLADRDIVPEQLAGEPNLEPNGVGATRLLQHFLLRADADQSLVDEKLLEALNRIFEPDTRFTRIQTKQVDDHRWGIYLREEGKGDIALSDSGSGLKTVILVLANMLLMPRLRQQSISDCIFAFEEVENNLHPGLIRRLLRYMERVALEEGATVFLTTHSNVAIDMFSGTAHSQIIHVTHEAGRSTARTVSDHLGHSGILDDLDVRASDLLQSNSVVWVEGPSDRVYINALLQLLYGRQLREGAHYQCVFYGGRLLSRLAAESKEVGEFVNMLKVNRNCALVMDRDKQVINDTKKRVQEEVGRVGGHAWVTQKKEIECDIPLEAIRLNLGNGAARKLKPLEGFATYLDSLKDGLGKAYARDKVGYAQELMTHVTLEMLLGESALLEKVRSLGQAIARWNQLNLAEAELPASDGEPPSEDLVT